MEPFNLYSLLKRTMIKNNYNNHNFNNALNNNNPGQWKVVVKYC